ncbi:MAG: hypothetical protein HN411_01285 [Waddliaceae bacterium]|nr:hypothetical protein [Waddliaceae bacterium]MBT4445211.1 hypothetical protein [Waddliaceae bacterium]
MSVLPYTITLLLLLSLMTYNSAKKYYEIAFTKNIYVEYMEKTIRDNTNTKIYTQYKNSRYSSEGTSDDNTVNDDNKPGEITKNSKINLYYLFRPAEEEKSLEKPLTYKLLKRLMYEMFHEAPFFSDASSQYPDILDTIITALIEKGEEYSIKQVKHLSNIDLDDEYLQEVFQRMAAMQGESGHPLYYHLDFAQDKVNNNKKIWIYHADRAVVSALFNGDKNSVDRFINMRTSIYREIRRRMKHDEEWKGDMRSAMETKLRHEALASLASCGASDYEAILDFRIKYSAKPPQ